MAHILVVDDLRHVQQELRRILESWGHQVTTRSLAGEALEWLREERPDLILADQMMPYLDGIEFRSRVRADPDLASIPVILMVDATASADETEERVRRLAPCVLKPWRGGWDEPVLARVVRDACPQEQSPTARTEKFPP